jgi:protein-S-isoprenylcysteine O-methyltransferase Ste14
MQRSYHKAGRRVPTARREPACGGPNDARSAPTTLTIETLSRHRLAGAHHWSDWLGLAAFTALAVALWRRAPEFGLAVIPGLSAELLVAASFLLRRPARRTAQGWFPRAVAYAHTFLPMVFIELASAHRPGWLAPATSALLATTGAVLWLGGALLALWPLWQLRWAFSVEPQARELVTSGPYRFARHPIYASYALVNAGLWLRHPTLPFGTVLAVWFALLALRIRYEEQVLESAFPAYTEYRARVGALGPRVGRLLRRHRGTAAPGLVR